LTVKSLTELAEHTEESEKFGGFWERVEGEANQERNFHTSLPPACPVAGACPASGASLKTQRTLRFCFFTESERTIR